jgi:hypothetical protein
VIFYWGVVVPATAFVVGRVFSGAMQGEATVVVAIVMVLNLLTLGRTGTKPFLKTPYKPDFKHTSFFQGVRAAHELEADWKLDEREQRTRDRVFFQSYQWVYWVAFVWFGVYALGQTVKPAWSLWLGPVCFAVFVALVAGLPHSIILWTEPDIEEGR